MLSHLFQRLSPLPMPSLTQRSTVVVLRLRSAVLVSCLILALAGCAPALIVGGTAAGFYVGNDERSLNEIVDDASITAAINTRFLKDNQVSAWDIDVETRLGVVTLYGNVSSAAREERAIELASKVNGVNKIVSRLTIVEREPPASKQSD